MSLDDDTPVRTAGQPRPTERALATFGEGAATNTVLGQRLRSVGGRWPTVAAIAIVVIALELFGRTVPDYLLPNTVMILEAVADIFTDGLNHLITTVVRFIAVLLTAITVGWLLGLFMGVKRYVGLVGQALARIVLATPALSIMLLVVLWMRSVEMRVFAATFIVALPFYVVATYESIKGIDPGLIEAARQFGPSRLQMLRVLLFPYTIEGIIQTTKSIALLCLRILVFAELIGGTTGAGAAMFRAQGLFRIDVIFAWTVVLIVLSFALMAIVDRLERYILRWRPENRLG